MRHALELGPLHRDEAELPEELRAKIEAVQPEKLPAEVIYILIAYYAANRPEDSDWIVLPVANFDCWFGGTNFGRKYLSQNPEEIIQPEQQLRRQPVPGATRIFAIDNAKG